MLLAFQGLVVARAAVEPVPARLREIAARATKRGAWPELRAYAEAQQGDEPKALAYFALGYQEYAAGEYAAAAQDLHEPATLPFFLADYAAYYSASAALKAGNPAQAGEMVRDFSTRFPESFLRLQALQVLAQALINSQKAQEAVQVLTAEPAVRQHPELSLLLAQAYEQAGDPLQAAHAYQDVYYAFPAFAESKAAGEAVRRLRSELGSKFPEATDEIETARLDLLVRASLFKEALKGYEDLLAAKPSSAHAGDWQLGKGRCLLRLRRDSEAVQVLSANLASPALNAERLALMMEAYNRADDTTSTLAALAQIQAIDAHSTAYESALYTAGGLFFRLGDWQNAGRQFQTLVESFPQGSQAQDAGWRMIWCSYLAGAHDQARLKFQAYVAQYPRSSHTPAALYWLGRLDEEQGDVGDAEALYALLENRFAHGFYAEQASLRKRRLPTAHSPGTPAPNSIAGQVAQVIPPRNAPSLPACSSYEPVEVLQPVLDLRAVSLDGLAEEYLRASLAARPQQPELRLYLSELEASRGNVTAGVFDAGKIVPDYAAYQFSELPKTMWDLLFPQNYWSLVQRLARLDRLDPYLVMGLIRQESAFNARAVSSANARGLMQVEPTTASRSKRASRVRSTGQRLFNPTYNVRFGCAYLKSLLKDFGDKPELALAAYNAGDFRVRDWTKSNAFHDSSEFLEAIPIHATRAYVEAVLRDAAIYRQLLTKTAKFAVCGR